MQITSTTLHAKRQQALATRDRLLADLNSQVGVIATLDHLIAILAEPEPVSVPSTLASSTDQPVSKP